MALKSSSSVAYRDLPGCSHSSISSVTAFHIVTLRESLDSDVGASPGLHFWAIPALYKFDLWPVKHILQIFILRPSVSFRFLKPVTNMRLIR